MCPYVIPKRHRVWLGARFSPVPSRHPSPDAGNARLAARQGVEAPNRLHHRAHDLRAQTCLGPRRSIPRRVRRLASGNLRRQRAALAAVLRECAVRGAAAAHPNNGRSDWRWWRQHDVSARRRRGRRRRLQRLLLQRWRRRRRHGGFVVVHGALWHGRRDHVAGADHTVLHDGTVL